MSAENSHNGDHAFEDFLEKELKALADRAQKRNICTDCLTDRIIVEMVSSLARSGIAASEILQVVSEGMALAEEADDSIGRTRRVH